MNHAIVYALEPGPDGGLVQKKVRHSNFPSTAKVLLSDRDGVLDFFARHTQPRRTDEIALHPPKGDAPGWNDGSKEAREKLESLGAHLAVPLLQGDSLIGLMLLGGKQSGSAFSSRDIEFAELVASSAVASIQKAKFYESDRTKTEFVSVAAHELLTPITAMRGYLSMVLVDGMGQVDERARGYLGKVAASADRLAALVRDLLSVSRLESGRIRMELKPTDVATVIRSAIDQLAPIAATKGLRLSFELREPVPLAMADSDRLMEVLVNLIGNAVKYTLAGSVTVSAWEDGGKVSVSVADTGLGIAPEARERLFEKFYRVRTAETEAIEGTGLGLYVTKSMVEAMGGTISVESAVGKGSTFLVGIPVGRSETFRKDSR